MAMKIIVELIDGTVLKMNTNYTRLHALGEYIDNNGGIEIDGIWYLKHTIKLLRMNEM